MPFYTMNALNNPRLAVKQAERLNSSVAEQAEALAQLSAVVGEAEAIKYQSAVRLVLQLEREQEAKL